VVNTNLIEQRMRQLDITADDLAIYMNKSVKTLTQIIHNEKDMVLYEAYMIADYLQITTDDICKFFFCSKEELHIFQDEGAAV